MLNKTAEFTPFLTLLTTATLVAACNTPVSESKTTFDNASIVIAQDLNLPESVTTVLEMTETDLERPEMGPRDEALILTENDNTFTLRYVFRFPQSSNANFRRWRLWVNHDIIGDGTGAEILAVEEYSERPSSEQVTPFRTAILNHWSNP